MMVETPLNAGEYDIRGLFGQNPAHIDVPITSFLSIALYNAIELLALLFLMFHSYSGRYFWSLLVTIVCGLLVSDIVLLLYYFRVVTSQWLPAIAFPIVWIFLVTGNSIVLYTRLHLIVRNQRLLRWTLSLIVFDGIVLHSLTFIVSVGSYIKGHEQRSFQKTYNVVEKLQLTWFSLQEILLNLVYIFHASRYLTGQQSIASILRYPLKTLTNDSRNTAGTLPTISKRARGILIKLILANVLEILMNVALVIIEYFNLYLIQITLKVMVYSIKLQVEFAMLTSLVDISTASEPHGVDPPYGSVSTASDNSRRPGGIQSWGRRQSSLISPTEVLDPEYLSTIHERGSPAHSSATARDSHPNDRGTPSPTRSRAWSWSWDKAE